MTDHFSSAERRLTLRLLAYWEKLRRGRPMPTEQDINPEDIADLWDNCFLVHAADLSKPDYNYTYLGENISEAYKAGLSEKDDENSMCSPNASKMAKGLAKVTATGKPLLEEGEFPNLHNETVKYRQCLLPLGENGKVVAIFGGMRFKVFPAQK